MPLVDMGLEELYKYNGSTPCPKDFDEYWDRGICEMKGISEKPTLIKKEFPANGIDFYDMYFIGTKGAKIHAKYVVPQNIKEKAPAVLMFHGLAGRSQMWSDLIIYASQGFVVAYLDVRGQAGLSQDIGGVTGTTYGQPFMRGLDGEKDDLLMRDVFLDTARLAGIVMDMDYVDENRVAVMGVSQGGGLSIACAALEPRVKKCAISVPYLSDYRRVWNMDLAKDAYDTLKYYFKNYDPLHEREDEIFERLGYIDIQNLAKRVRADVIMATGLMDTLCPPSTQFAMFNKLNCNKKSYIYPDFGHETMAGYNDIIFEFLTDLNR